MSTITELKLLIDDLVDTSTSTFPDAKKVRLLNKAQDKVVNILIKNDYLNQYDDDNYTDLAEGFLNLTSGQNDYNTKEDENFADLLFVRTVYIKDTSGTWKEVEKDDLFTTTETGEPTKWRLTGKTIIFNKTPGYTYSNGIKVVFVRKPEAISISDTTKEIGMPRTFHHLIALYVAYDFARSKRMDNANDLLNEILLEEQRLGFFVASKDKSVVNRMTPANDDNR